MKRLILFLIFTSPLFCLADDLTLDQALQKAQNVSPSLQAASYYEKAAVSNIDEARAGYMPTLNAEAIDSDGFAASSGLTGVSGLMGSPYRSGWAYGAVASADIWDFGQTSAKVSIAQAQSHFEKLNTQSKTVHVEQAVIENYFDCVQLQTQVEVWKDLLIETERAAKEVDKFVGTGQRSVVDKYLMHSQREEAATEQATYQKQLEVSKARLAGLTGLAQQELSCPDIQKITGPSHILSPSQKTLVIQKALKIAEIAKLQLDQTESIHWPKIIAVGSVGDMEQSRVVSKQNYALGIGVIIPLFDYKLSSDIEKNKALALAKEKEIEQAHLELDDLNAKFDQIIQSAQVKNNHLEKESQVAGEGFQLAKKRYYSSQGSLIDYREAIKNLFRIRTEAINSNINFVKYTHLKNLLNKEIY